MAERVKFEFRIWKLEFGMSNLGLRISDFGIENCERKKLNG